MVISGSFLKIQDDSKRVLEFAKSMDQIHFDVMDGKFTEKATSSPSMVSFGSSNKPIDVHLMVIDVKKYVDEVLKFKPEFITFHIEIGNTLEYINYIKSKGTKVGIAINPSTNIKLIYPFLNMIDLILIMSVPAGAGGQKFIDVSNRIDEIYNYREKNNLNFLIEVDGGINDKTIHSVINADICVVGSFITDGNFDERLEKLKGEIKWKTVLL